MICYHWRNYAVRNVHFIFFYDSILEGKLYLTIVLTDRASLVAQMVSCNAGDLDSVAVLGRSLGEGNGNHPSIPV